MRQIYGQTHREAVEELQKFLSTTEKLLRTLNDEGVESTNVLRERVAVGVESVQGQLDDAMESADEAARMGRELIRDNPWTALGIGALVGIAVGWGLSAGGSRLFR